MMKKKYRIGIDARSIDERVCGVSRVAFCMINALSKIDHENEYIIYTDSIITSFDLGDNFQIKATHCSRMNPVKDFQLFSYLKNDNLDVFHSMHSWLPAFIHEDVRSVVTIYDLFSVTDPNFFIKHKPFHKLYKAYFSYLTKRTVKMADAIVTISEYSKKEIVRCYPFSNRKIDVIYLAAGIINNGTVNNTNKKIIDGEYLLYIGNCRSYKNVDLLIDGYRAFLLHNKNVDIKLVVAGNDNYSEVMRRADKFGISDKVKFFNNPSDEDIKELYKNAFAFIFPSKFEGFGIPVLEAMSYGIPVIISDAAALVEVAGDAALVFRKNNAEELCFAIKKMLSDNKLRSELVQKGTNRVKEFTWESSAMKLKALYEKMLTN